MLVDLTGWFIPVRTAPMGDPGKPCCCDRCDETLYEIWELTKYGGARVDDYNPFLTLRVEFIRARKCF